MSGDGKIFFHDLRTCLNVELVHGIGVVHRFARHTHRVYCIGLVEAGTRLLAYGGESLEVGPGQLFMIPPHTPHECECRSRPHSYKLLLAAAQVVKGAWPAAAEDRWGGGSPLPTVLTDSQLFDRLVQLHALLCSDDPLLAKQESLYATLGDVLDRQEQTAGKQPLRPVRAAKISQVQQYIEEHYTEALSLLLLAKLAQNCPIHFLRAFREQVGVSPHTYQLQLRIRHARELLAAGHPAVETALAMGFGDQCHFTNVFKQFVGITPGKFRIQYVPDKDGSR